MSESVYLDTLNNTEVGLTSPLPLEITGKEGNYVATWLEGKIEGEGGTKQEAVEDCRNAVITRYKGLRDKVVGSLTLTGDDEQVWVSLLHFIAERGRRPLGPGEEYIVDNPTDPDYKGPFFG